MKYLSTIIISLFISVNGYGQSDYSLQQIVDSALQNNIAIRKAKYDIDAAKEQRKEAFTKYFPNVSAVGIGFNASTGMAKMNINPSEVIPAEWGAIIGQSLPPEILASLNNPINISMMKNGVVGSVIAVQPVFAGGQIVNGNKLAKIGEEVSILQLNLSKNEVEKTAEQYYWQVIALQEKMNTIKAVETLLGDINKDVTVALKAGVILRNDLLQVQLRQNEVKSQKLKLQNGLSLMKMLLAQYCGLRDTTFTLQSSTSQPTMQSEIGDKASVLNTLPEFQLLQKQVEATTLQKKMAVGKNMPSVAVGAGYNYHNLLDKNQNFGMFFATVSIPISDWWGGSHAIKQKKIEQQKAIEQMTDASEMLQIRMQKAWNDVVEAGHQLSLAQKGIEQAEENLRINRDCYKAGTSKMSDLLEAQLLYQQTRNKYVDANADYHNKLLEYKHITGQK